MTRTSDNFGALAMAILTVFALWSTTLTVPATGNATSAIVIAAPSVL